MSRCSSAAVEQARINLGYTRVLLPRSISGRIGKSSVTPGALVTASQTTPLATVQNLDKVYVDVTESTGDLLQLRRDMAAGSIEGPRTAQANLILEDGSLYPLPGRAGVLYRRHASIRPPGRSACGRCSPTPRACCCRACTCARASARVWPRAGILAPAGGGQPRPAGGEATAFVVGPDNKAQLRILTVSQTVGDNWLVTGGLKPGDRLIVDGLQKVKPGGAVKPLPPADVGR